MTEHFCPTTLNRSSVKKTSATDSFQSASDFVERLRSLRQLRRDHKLELLNQVFNRQSLSGREREDILAKTDSRCHICGGPIEDNTWEADHVVSHPPGGQQSIDDYLPAHSICSGYRRLYEPEEFQWILKLGVWLRTQIEIEAELGQRAARAFCKYDCVRAFRCKRHTAKPKAAQKLAARKGLLRSDDPSGQLAVTIRELAEDR